MAAFKFRVATPIGPLMVILAGKEILSSAFNGGWSEQRDRATRRLGNATLSERAPPARLARLFERYFRGRFEALDELDLDPGGTEFQADVWDAVRATPPGKTRTYRELAAEIGKPSAVRAVSRAVASNPIQLAIPCHRVVGADGCVPGPPRVARRRSWLLEHEGHDPGC